MPPGCCRGFLGIADLEEPPRRSLHTPEVPWLSAIGEIAQEELDREFGYHMGKLWVGLELQLDYGIKTSPSSNFC